MVFILLEVQGPLHSPSSSCKGLGALHGAFSPLFHSRWCQTKHAQFSAEIGCNNIFRGSKVMF